jgi:beta-xylosidase
MPDWHIWSSNDLIHWQHERTIEPTETYMGKSVDCWATDMGYRNGKYYFYFSNKNLSTGVMVGNQPEGPFTDALGKPLLDSALTTTKEYDPSILMDDDSMHSAYIIFGHHRDNDSMLGYYIAKLNDDMISLAEQPRKVYFSGAMDVLNNDDKPNLHKYKGLYYLSSGSHYATSTNVYGPYTKRGNSGFGKYGLTAQAHGNYFMWRNQWFHTWCKFHLGKEVARYRESYLTYVHYKKDGSMVDDTTLLSKYFENGVGQYNADWERIEAEWYMAGDKIEKGENAAGFEVKACFDKGYLYFPNVRNIKRNATLVFNVNPHVGGTIEVRLGGLNGKLMGSVAIPFESSKNYFNYRCTLKNIAGTHQLYLVFKGASAKNLFSIDSMQFE